jgi:hypothetical protein
MLICLGWALSACTSSSTSSGIQSGNQNYDNNYRNQTASTKQTYDQKQEEKAKADSAITVMQLGLETGDVYPGDDYYVHAVIDNPTDRKNLQYVWSTTDGEVTEVPESERGRLQTLVEDIYSKATPEAAAGEAVPAAPLPETGNTPAGATSAQPSEGVPVPTDQPVGGAPTTGTPVIQPGTTPSTTTNPVTVPVPDRGTSSAVGPNPTVKPVPPASEGGAVKTEEQHMTSNHKGVYERRIVAGPEEDSYFSKDDQAEISYDAQAPTADENEVLQDVAGEQSDSIAARAQDSDLHIEQAPADRRNGARRLIDERDEPEGSPNAVESGISGDPYDTGDQRDKGWERKTTAQLDRERGLYGGADLTADLDEAEADSTALRSSNRKGTSADEAKEVTADEAYKKFSLVTDEPYIRWTPAHPGESKLYCKVRWKTDDLTKPTELAVDVRLREPTVKISDDEFPDMVREDEPLFIRIDGDNLPAFNKGLFTLSFDPDKLSFREAELGEFFDDSRGAKLFYAQPDKLAGKVILAIDSNTELSELSGAGPLLYVKFKAKRDIESRDETDLALVQDTASQYVLDDSGDNILPLATEHGTFETALLLPPRLNNAANGVGDANRTLTPGEQTPDQIAAAAEAAKAQAEAAKAGTDTAAVSGSSTVTVPTPTTQLPSPGTQTQTQPTPQPQNQTPDSSRPPIKLGPGSPAVGGS